MTATRGWPASPGNGRELADQTFGILDLVPPGAVATQREPLGSRDTAPDPATAPNRAGPACRTRPRARPRSGTRPGRALARPPGPGNATTRSRPTSRARPATSRRTARTAAAASRQRDVQMVRHHASRRHVDGVAGEETDGPVPGRTRPRKRPLLVRDQQVGDLLEERALLLHLAEGRKQLLAELGGLGQQRRRQLAADQEHHAHYIRRRRPIHDDGRTGRNDDHLRGGSSQGRCTTMRARPDGRPGFPQTDLQGAEQQIGAVRRRVRKGPGIGRCGIVSLFVAPSPCW